MVSVIGTWLIVRGGCLLRIRVVGIIILLSDLDWLFEEIASL
jgi:hypothetical protein